MTRLDQAFIKIYADRGHQTPGSAEIGEGDRELTGGDCPEAAEPEGDLGSGQEPLADSPDRASLRSYPSAVDTGESLIGRPFIAESLSADPLDAAARATDTVGQADESAKAEAAEAHVWAELADDTLGEIGTQDAPSAADGSAVYRLDRGSRAGAGAWVPDGFAAPSPHVSLPPVEVQVSDSGEVECEVCWDGAAGDGGFWALLQVDRVAWPSACLRLAKVAADELQRLADALVEATADGVKVVGIGGCRRGEGATTLLLCLGRRLAELGLKVVLVDANLVEPQLAGRLGLQPEAGWEEALAGRIPLEEVVIESVGDRLAVLPVCRVFEGTDAPSEDESRLVEGLGTLASHYDLVLLDPGPLEELGAVGGSLARGLGSRLDAIALVHHGGLTPVEDLDEVRRSLAATEILQLGVIENFVGHRDRQTVGSDA